MSTCSWLSLGTNFQPFFVLTLPVFQELRLHHLSESYFSFFSFYLFAESQDVCFGRHLWRSHSPAPPYNRFTRADCTGCVQMAFEYYREGNSRISLGHLFQSSVTYLLRWNFLFHSGVFMWYEFSRKPKYQQKKVSENKTGSDFIKKLLSWGNNMARQLKM